MTLVHAALLLIVPSVVALALAVRGGAGMAPELMAMTDDARESTREG
jgi:hypothetical protein